jgi:uncharacterized membrane protein
MSVITEHLLLKLIPAMIGITVIILSLIILKFPPQKINYYYGYRTPASMKNQKNWDFSQIYSSHQFIKIGIVLIIISIASLFSNQVFFYNPIYISSVIIITFIYGIVRTEYAIKNRINEVNSK